MRTNNIIKRTLFLILLSLVMINAQAQTGLNFQGVARTSNNVILASQAITIKLSILQGSSTGTADYIETRKVITNAQGLFTAVIGDTGAISTLGNFTTINWKLSPKFLKIEMDPAAGTNFITMGTTQFQYVAYAQFAKSVDAENIVGIVPVSLGGTGASTIAGLKTALVLNNVNNTTDLNKPISTLTQTALDLKLNSADTVKYVKQTYADSALLTKLSTTGNAATSTTASTATTAGTASTATKLATVRNINGVGFDGSGDITVTADAGTLTGTTLKSTITGSSLTSVGTLANLTVTNAIAGSITGNAATATSATTATTAGTASTATKLATSRNINGVSFDGSGDITITADAGTLTGTTLKSTVTGSSLTSVGTIASLSTGAITNSGKVIVGASSAATASAVLEASSTTQGFLPPRMTRAQRNAINTPASGLVVWCNNCGAVGELQVYSENANWTNLSGTTAAGVYTPTIGEAYQGGKVAYVLQLGDPGYDPTTPHGLIAATSDQSTGIRWVNGYYTNTGATGTAIGTGLANTNTIISSQGATSTSYAAGLARAYTGGGYTDWYLPSKDELNKLYLNKTAIGGFGIDYYWSSTEFVNSFYGAWIQSFSNGVQSFNFKDFAYYVRAVRAF
jgi:hypothetical protein